MPGNPYEGLFAEADDLTAFGRDVLGRPAPNAHYLIFLTPRSGSSWLGDLLLSTGLVGNPDEWFNLRSVPGKLVEYGPCTPRTFAEIVRRLGGGGVQFSFPQHHHVGRLVDLDAVYPAPKTIYLTRRNFVQQGISLYRAVASNLFHDKTGSEAPRVVPYDGDKIKKWVVDILQQEWRCEQLFRAHEWSPLRLAYEDALADHVATVRKILTHLGRTEPVPPLSSVYRKLPREADWEERFVNDNAEFVARWRDERGRASPVQRPAKPPLTVPRP
jgi:LPS sulfotransferase NodH